MSAKHRRSRRGRPPRPVPKTLPEDLYDYDDDPAPTGRLRSSDAPLLGPNGQRMRVIDDWPECVPVTEAEIDVFERWFGDVFDELLNPNKPEGGLSFLSQTDRNTH